MPNNIFSSNKSSLTRYLNLCDVYFLKHMKLGKTVGGFWSLNTRLIEKIIYILALLIYVFYKIARINQLLKLILGEPESISLTEAGIWFPCWKQPSSQKALPPFRSVVLTMALLIEFCMTPPLSTSSAQHQQSKLDHKNSITEIRLVSKNPNLGTCKSYVYSVPVSKKGRCVVSRDFSWPHKRHQYTVFIPSLFGQKMITDAV